MADRAVFQARVVLLAYLAFVISAISFVSWSHNDQGLHEAIVPLIGWGGLTQYAPTIFFAGLASFHTRREAVWTLIQMLGWVTFVGTVLTVDHAFRAWSGEPDFDNPFLKYHPLRPVFTTLIPGAWLLVLWWTGRTLPAARAVETSFGNASSEAT